MKIILYLFIINSFNKVYTQFSTVNYIQTPNVQNNNLNFYNSDQSLNLRNRETINYQILQYTNNQNPLIQNQFDISYNVPQKNIFNSNSNQRNYETVNLNPPISNQFTFSNNVQDQNLLSNFPKRDQYQFIQYNTKVRGNPATVIRSTTPVQDPVKEIGTPSPTNIVTTQQYSTTIQVPKRNIQGRALGTTSSKNFVTNHQYSNIPVVNRKNPERAAFTPTSENFLTPQQYSNIPLERSTSQGRTLVRQSTTNFITPQQYSTTQQIPKRSIENSISTTFESRFGEDDNSSNQSTHPDTFQYQYSKGWSVHEAISVNDLIKPQLEYGKNLKYSTPYTPEDQYYKKFYNIYNEVENHGRPDLIQYEKESVNDDFNGRSIVAPGQYPHMAAIGFLSNEDKIEFKCGGSLISDSFVITAAHCCNLNGETPIIVKLGIINLKDQTGNSNPQRSAIKEIIVHPSYNATITYHDIALLKLQKALEFTNFVRPILLWTSDHIPYERVFTMGYGSTSFAKAPTNILTELSLSLIPLQQCKQSLPPSEKTPLGITETQICGRDLEKNRDTCQGDSGGPLQLNLEHRKNRNTYRYYLVGIISYGEFCGSKKPGIYTRVSSYCKWIASIVWPEYFDRFQK